MNFDQLEQAADFGIDTGMCRLHQRRLAHAARSPEQGIVRWQTLGKANSVLDQDIAHSVDALEQAKIDAADSRNRHQSSVRMPDECVGARHCSVIVDPFSGGSRGGGDHFESTGDPVRGIGRNGRFPTFCRAPPTTGVISWCLRGVFRRPVFRDFFAIFAFPERAPLAR